MTDSAFAPLTIVDFGDHQTIRVVGGGLVDLSNYSAAPWMTARERNFAEIRSSESFMVANDLHASWQASDKPVPVGYIVGETDTARFKIADGSRLYKDLPYQDGYISRDLFDLTRFVFWVPNRSNSTMIPTKPSEGPTTRPSTIDDSDVPDMRDLLLIGVAGTLLRIHLEREGERNMETSVRISGPRQSGKSALFADIDRMLFGASERLEGMGYNPENGTQTGTSERCVYGAHIEEIMFILQKLGAKTVVYY